MPKFDHEIEVEAPVDYVFAWGTDPENWQRATPGLTAVNLIEETDDGFHYRNTFRMLGRSVTSDELYTVDEDNWRTTSVFDDDEMRGEMHYEFTETDNGTNVRLHGEFEPETSLFERAIQPVVTSYMNHQFRNTNRTMKELIEAEVAADQQAA